MSRSSKRIAAKHQQAPDAAQEQREHNAEAANASRFLLAAGPCHYQTTPSKAARAYLSGNKHCWHTRLTEGLQQQECCHCPAMRTRPKEETDVKH